MRTVGVVFTHGVPPRRRRVTWHVLRAWRRRRRWRVLSRVQPGEDVVDRETSRALSEFVNRNRDDDWLDGSPPITHVEMRKLHRRLREDEQWREEHGQR